MSQDKTEQPTPRQLRKAREQGDVPVSAVLSQAIGFVAALALLPAAAATAASWLAGLVTISMDGRVLEPLELATVVLTLTLPLVTAAGLASGVVSFVQGGGNLSFRRIQPDLARLDPFQGLKGLFGIQRLFALVRALCGMGACVFLVFVVFRSLVGALANSVGEVPTAFALAGSSATRVLWYAALIGLALGFIDQTVVRHAWQKRWMMTRDEVRRESRESEGDPEVKAARRRAHQEALSTSVLGAVKNASVVIVNPTHLAIALRYDEDEDAAPCVVAQGRGELAQWIVQTAHQHGIPVIQDVPVARALAELEIGDEIPEALYQAVAEILRELWASER